MAPADVILKRAVLGLSIALVLLLSAAALVRLFSDDTGEAAPGPEVDDEPSSPSRPYPGDRLEIDDAEFPLTISCLRDRSVDDPVYLVIIRNGGQLPADYLVSAELVDDEGTAVEALAEATQLRPGEEREVVLLPDEEVSARAECRIRAIQGDRRVLLGSR